MINTRIPTRERARFAEINAILSSCCGYLGEATLTDSAVVILFAGMLGAGDMFSMITTSLLPLFNGICVIPMAWFAAKFGSKRLILTSCTLSAIAYFLAVSSPYFGRFSAAVLLTMILLFALCLTGFIAGWFPLLDTFLSSERRTTFFSRMRFCHQLTATVFLFIAGAVIGKAPQIWALQLVLLIGAILFMGRALFIARIPVFPVQQPDALGFSAGLSAAVANKPLTGFSIYLFVVNLAAFGTVPLTMLYLKNSLHAPANVVVLISATALFGMLVGYLGANGIIRRLGVTGSLVAFHLCFALVNFALFFVGKGTTITYVLIACLLLLYNGAIAAMSIVASAEMMALTRPGNKTMAMAFSGAFSYGGSGLSRLVTSLILGSGLLATQWHLGTMRVCYYQTLYLLFTAAVVFAAVFFLLLQPRQQSAAS
ncbi:MAG TPA: MFS transporter [Armatimonadota bacterium]|nr:MFS transporter [Armatimonadota bacterium]